MIFTLQGIFIKIRKPEWGDIPLLKDWLASDAYIENLGGLIGDDDFYKKKSIEMLNDNADDKCDNKYFIIEDKFKAIAVGLIILNKIDFKNGNVEQRYIIGNEKYRNNLIAAEVNIIIANYIFNDLRLHKITSYVFDHNKSATKMNSFAAKLDGVLREHQKIGDKYVDVLVSSFTKNDFMEFIAKHKMGLLRKHFESGLLTC